MSAGRRCTVTWPDAQGRCSHSDAGDGVHRCHEVDSPVTTTPHTVCACPCGTRTATPKPYPLAQVKLERDGRGSVVVDGVELNSEISEVTVLAAPMRGTKVVVTMPCAELAAQGEIILSEKTKRALTMLGWTSPEQLGGMSKAFSEAARVELQDALGGLGTVLREWSDLLAMTRNVVRIVELKRTTDDACCDEAQHAALAKVAAALGDYAPSEVKWSRVIEEITELAGRMEGLEK